MAVVVWRKEMSGTVASRSFLIEVVLFFQSRESFVWITPVLAGCALAFIVFARFHAAILTAARIWIAAVGRCVSG